MMVSMFAFMPLRNTTYANAQKMNAPDNKIPAGMRRELNGNTATFVEQKTKTGYAAHINKNIDDFQIIDYASDTACVAYQLFFHSCELKNDLRKQLRNDPGYNDKIYPLLSGATFEPVSLSWGQIQ